MLKKLALFLALLLLPVALWCYSQFVEREHIEKTEHVVESADWHGGELRLAVLADLHARPADGEYLDRIVMAALSLRPHAVLLLGDYLNGHTPQEGMSIGELEEHLRPLSALPCYAVLGNHDYSYAAPALRAMFSRLGMQCVEGKRVELCAAGGKLDIAGIRCRYAFDTPGLVPDPRAGVPMLLLSHTPVGAQHAHKDTLLTVSGHSHGGQVCLPGGCPVWMADGKTPKEWAAGMVQVQGRPCYVTRGLGTSFLPIRFCCRPELTLLRIKSPTNCAQ